MSLVQTEDDIKEYIRLKLGYGTVDVELTDDQLDMAIDQAKNWFAKTIGQLRAVFSAAVPETRVYQMPDDCEQVVDVVFGSSADLSDVADLSGQPLGYIAGTVYSGYEVGMGADNLRGSNGGTWLSPTYGGRIWFSRLLEIYQRWEMTKSFSGSGEWSYDRWSNSVVFSTGSSGAVIIVYMTRDIDVGVLKQKEYWYLREYSLAEAFEVLGYIRGKYSELPSAGGGLSLNADTLLSRAESIKQQLEEEVKRYRGGHGVIVVG